MKLGSRQSNLVKKLKSILKIWTKCRLNLNEVNCTGCQRFFTNKGAGNHGNHTYRSWWSLSEYEATSSVKTTFQDFPGVVLPFSYTLMDICCLKRDFLPSTTISWNFVVYLLSAEINTTLTPSLLPFVLNSVKVERHVYLQVPQFSFHKSSRGSCLSELPSTFIA